MNEQDRDLIAALAEGRLNPDAAETASARIEADPELVAELSDQIAAIQFLQSDDAPLLTSSERAMLHANLAEQLNLVGAPAVPPPTPQRRSWWAPVFGLATAAVVVTAFVLILPGTSNESFDQAGAPASSEDTAELDTTAAARSAPQVSTTLDQGLINDAGDVSVYETNSIELDALLNEIEGAESHDDVDRELSGLSFRSKVNLDAGAIEACLDSLANEIPPNVSEVRVIGAAVAVDSTTVHVGFDYGEGLEGGMSFLLEDCSLIRHAEQ